MKSKILLALAGLLIVSTLFISPVSAQSPVIYRANGTLDEYNPGVTAEIFVGSWRIKIKDNKVNFKARYLELNVVEQIPGTKDKFRLVLTDVTTISISGSQCEIEGTLVFYKRGFDPVTGEFGFYTFSFTTKITIDPSEIQIDFLPPVPSPIPGYPDYDYIRAPPSLSALKLGVKQNSTFPLFSYFCEICNTRY
ncbi:MAG: hypothetical protein ACE5OW_04655 [Candidatus Bathyarchaeia archaeon]